MKKILITGATGSIGQRLVGRLIAQEEMKYLSSHKMHSELL